MNFGFILDWVFDMNTIRVEIISTDGIFISFALFSINSFNFDSSMEFAPPSMRGDGVHGMQHMKPIGTPGRPPPNHQGQGHGSNTMLADAGYGPPGGGILKKPCPYGSQMEVPSLDKDKWLEENADRLSRLERLDRLSMSSQNQLNVQQVCYL